MNAPLEVIDAGRWRVSASQASGDLVLATTVDFDVAEFEQHVRRVIDPLLYAGAPSYLVRHRGLYAIDAQITVLVTDAIRANRIALFVAVMNRVDIKPHSFQAVELKAPATLTTLNVSTHLRLAPNDRVAVYWTCDGGASIVGTTYDPSSELSWLSISKVADIKVAR